MKLTKLARALAIAMSIILICLCFAGCTTSEATGSGSGYGQYSYFIVLILIVVVFYFFMIRPENKKKKKAQEMRDSLTVGDYITTIGGITGRIVHVSEKFITFETGEDRVRIQVAKWAISSTGKGAEEESQQ